MLTLKIQINPVQTNETSAELDKRNFPCVRQTKPALMDGKKLCLAEHNAIPTCISQPTAQPHPIHLLLAVTKPIRPKEIF
jgi:hypothetical protein